MRTLALLFLGVVVGWAGVAWSREAFDDKLIVAPRGSERMVTPQQEDYLAAKTLDEAVAVLQGKLKESHSPILPLVNKDAVRAAILTSIEGTKRANAKAALEARDNERRYIEASAEHFDTVVVPIYEAILKEEQWPSRAFFQTSDSGTSHSVRLHVDVRKADGTGYIIGGGPKVTGYGLSVLLVEFGDPGPSEFDGTLIIGGSGN